MLDSFRILDVPQLAGNSLKDAEIEGCGLARSAPASTHSSRPLQGPSAVATLLGISSRFKLFRAAGCGNLPPSGCGACTSASTCSTEATSSSSNTSTSSASSTSTTSKAETTAYSDKQGHQAWDHDVSDSNQDVCAGSSTSAQQHSASAPVAPGAMAGKGSSCDVFESHSSVVPNEKRERKSRTRDSLRTLCAGTLRKLKLSGRDVGNCGEPMKPGHALMRPPDRELLCSKLLLLSSKLQLLPQRTAKCSSTPRRPTLPPLSLTGKHVLAGKRQQRRAASLFEATGCENIRLLLGLNAVWGSITRYKMLMLAESIHEQHLSTVLQQPVHQVDWAGDPAWEEDFSAISNKYGQRVRQFLFWWGGALAHLWQSGHGEDDSPGEAEAAQAAVVLTGAEPEPVTGTATT